MWNYLFLWLWESNAWICVRHQNTVKLACQYTGKGLNLHILARKQTGPLELHMTCWRCPGVTAVITSGYLVSRLRSIFITLAHFKYLSVCCNTEPGLETFSGAGLYVEWVFLSSSSYCHLRVSSCLSPLNQSALVPSCSVVPLAGKSSIVPLENAQLQA